MGWLNLRLKEAESDFDFCQLSESGSVTLDRSGLVAVFTPEHARDHATGANKGTMRNPNMRMREDLTRFQTAPASPSSTTTHGGYPTPGAPTVPTTVKPPTKLDFASPPPRTPSSRMDYAQGVSPTLALVLVAVVQLFVIALSFGASGYSATACHAVSPSWACNSLGFTLPELHTARAPAPTPAIDVHSRTDVFEPGARASLYNLHRPVVPAWYGVVWRHRSDPYDVPSGGVGSWALLLPMLACIVLMIRSLRTTESFITARTPRIPWPTQASFGKGLGHHNDPPTGPTSSTRRRSTRASMRATKRLSRGASSPGTCASSSRFLSTLGEAPLWISMLLLAHEVVTRVLPCLLGISIATVALGWYVALIPSFARRTAVRPSPRHELPCAWRATSRPP